ncbi:hypothetical protein BC833DRAFT_565445 [Globomyces pollinis-pini]|nr:hypothetical protein BC833DRAFT_565445 [Globomyces pollinis-pini]
MFRRLHSTAINVGDLVLIQRKQLLFAVVINTPSPFSTAFSSIGPDGHLILHSNNDTLFVSPKWAFLPKIQSKLPKQIPVGLSHTSRSILQSIHIPPDVTNHMALYQNAVERLRQMKLKSLDSTYRLFRRQQIDCVSLVEITKTLFEVPDPTPAEICATYNLLMPGVYFQKTIPDSDITNPLYNVLSLDEHQILQTIINQLEGRKVAISYRDISLSEFLDKSHKIIDEYRAGKSISVSFSDNDKIFIDILKKSLKIPKSVCSVYQRIAHTGIIRNLSKYFSFYPSNSDVVLFLKQTGVFPAHEDVGLYRYSPKGSMDYLEGQSAVGDIVTKEASDYANSLVLQGQFVYNRDGTSIKSNHPTSVDSVEGIDKTIVTNNVNDREVKPDLTHILDKSTDEQAKKSLKRYISPLVLPNDISSDFPLQDDLSHLRVDFGQEPIYVIDGYGAHELDDGISLEKTPDGDWIHVHIADPTAYIPPSSPLAQLAQLRSTSIYLAHRHFPMMPDFLASKLCDLGVSKCALTFSARLNSEGEIADYKVSPTVLNNVKLTLYDDVDTVLKWDDIDGMNRVGNQFWVTQQLEKSKIEKHSSFVNEDINNLLRLQELTNLHRGLRVRRGAILPDNFELSIKVKEAPVPLAPMHLTSSFDHPVFNQQTTIHIDPFSQSHRSPSRLLVSEAMVLAGRIASKYCQDHHINALYRSQQSILDLPNMFPNLLETQKQMIKDGLENAYDKRDPVSGVIPFIESQSLIKFMQPAKVTESPLAHFSMGITGSDNGSALSQLHGYVKVTSPLRRYQDMLVHWQIKASMLNQEPAFTKPQVSSINMYTHGIADRVTKLQRESERYWMIEYIRRQAFAPNHSLEISNIQNHDPFMPNHSDSHTAKTIYNGIITSVFSGGKFRISIPELGGFSSLCLSNETDALGVGDMVSVVIHEADPSRGHCFFIKV